MSWIALGVGGTALAVGAGTSAAASKKAGDKSKKAAESTAEYINRLASEFGIDPRVVANWSALGDSALAGLTADNLNRIGYPSGAALQTGSPIGVLLNTVGASGLSEDELARQRSTVSGVAQVYQSFRRKGLSPGEAKQKTIKRKGKDQWGAFRNATRLSGYSSPVELLEDQWVYEEQAAQIQAENLEIAPQVRASRNDALLDMLGIASNLPDSSEQGFLNAEGRFANVLNRRADEDLRIASDRAAEQAQRYGTNPAGSFAELERRDQLRREEIDEVDALRFASQLMQGQQSTSSSAISSILSALSGADPGLTNASNLYATSQRAQGSLAQSQATALNQLDLTTALTILGLQSDAATLRGQGQLAQIEGNNAAAQSIGGLFTNLGTSIIGGRARGGGGAGTSLDAGALNSFNSATSVSQSPNWWQAGTVAPAAGG